MNTNTLVIVAVVVIVLLLVAFMVMRQRQSKALKSRFGSEYDRTVDEVGGRRAAEAHLHKVEKRVSTYDIRPLNADELARFTARWNEVQRVFVDNPTTAVNNADSLLAEVMTVRGYPVTDFDQAAADLSVDHPDVVQNYRAGHDIAVKHQRGEATTEDLRQAMIHYRSLFTDLTGPAAVAEPASTR